MTGLLKILAQGICMRARNTFCNNGNVMSVSPEFTVLPCHHQWDCVIIQQVICRTLSTIPKIYRCGNQGNNLNVYGNVCCVHACILLEKNRHLSNFKRGLKPPKGKEPLRVCSRISVGKRFIAFRYFKITEQKCKTIIIISSMFM